MLASRYIFTCFIFIILFLAPVLSMINDIYNYVVLQVLILFIIVVFTYVGGKVKIGNKVSKGFFIFSLLFFLMILSNVNALPIFGFKSLGNLIYPLAVYVISFAVFSSDFNRKVVLLSSTFSSLSLLLCFFISVFVAKSNYESLGYATGSNWANVSICSSILLFLSNKKSLKYLGVLLLLVIIALSLKRSSLVFLLLCFLLVALKFCFDIKRIDIKTLAIRGVFISISIVLISRFIPSGYFDGFENRVSKLSEDGGAGRTTILESAYDVWVDAPFLDKVFGLGYRYFNLTGEIDASSLHNDYADFLFSYGFFPFILFLVFLFRYVLISISAIIKGQSNYSFYIVFLATLVTYSLTSGVFYFSVMFTSLFISMAYIDSYVAPRGIK